MKEKRRRAHKNEKEKKEWTRGKYGKMTYQWRREAIEIEEE